ncbi:phage tail protein [Pantanalinema rosaneae CENA516]|uniref:phage tail protein n=1 Tax=Pantanalinema rosaneae TaxID=1620701 RepID=UPI003D6ED70C
MFSFSGSLSLDASASVSLAVNPSVGPPGQRIDPYQVFNFWIDIEGIRAGGFSECSGLQVETELGRYLEGGLNDYEHTFIGRTKYPPLILKHGLSDIDGLWRWHQEVVQGIEGKMQRHNGTIWLLDKDTKTPVMGWNFKQAFPYKWIGPELKAESNTIAFESVELVHQGLSRADLGGATAGAGIEFSASLGLSI